MQTVELPKLIPCRELIQRRAHAYSARHHRALLVIDYVARFPTTAAYLSHRKWSRNVEYRVDNRYARRVPTWKRVLHGVFA